jgi:putative ABC transport system permease protein
MALAVRTDGDPARFAASIIAAIRSADPEQPVYGVAPMEEIVGRSFAQHRLEAILIAAFAGLALLLAGIGVYGVTAYAVERRVREFGIRMALGADPHQLIALVMRRITAICAMGAAAGLCASAALGDALRTVLFRVSPTDWPSYAAAAVVLFAVALAAAWIPSRRSAAIDPLQSLRAE